MGTWDSRKGRSSSSTGKGIVWDHARGGKLRGCAKGRVKEEGWSRGKMLKSCVSLRHGIPEKNPNQTVGTPIFLSLLPPPHTAGTKDRGQIYPTEHQKPQQRGKNPPAASSAGMAFISRPVERRARASSFSRSLSTTCGQDRTLSVPLAEGLGLGRAGDSFSHR